jgi:stress-induced morphogen
MDQGYSHREAERLAGAHRGPKDLQSALTHRVRASQPSEKMLSELKDLAGHWLGRADRHEKINADPEANPMKHAAGKMLQAHEEHSKGFNDAYNTFLGSDELKNKKGLERHKAIQAWKNDWKTKNPEYHQSAENVSGAQKAYKEAGDARKKSLQEKLDHIYSGGAGLATGMDMQEAAQHVGGEKNEDGGFQARTIMDPAAVFAGNNKDFIQQKQAQSQPPAAPAKPKADVVKIIRRAAKPEQLERFNRVTSAKSMLGGNKPQGGENA